MISMVHDPVRDEIGEHDYPPIPAGGRRMDMTGTASPPPSSPPSSTIDITGAFYGVVEDLLGVEQFMSIWIDFLPQD